MICSSGIVAPFQGGNRRNLIHEYMMFVFYFYLDYSKCADSAYYSFFVDFHLNADLVDVMLVGSACYSNYTIISRMVHSNFLKPLNKFYKGDTIYMKMYTIYLPRES